MDLNIPNRWIRTQQKPPDWHKAFTVMDIRNHFQNINYNISLVCPYKPTLGTRDPLSDMVGSTPTQYENGGAKGLFKLMGLDP